jgi:hypothetical protein
VWSGQMKRLSFLVLSFLASSCPVSPPIRSLCSAIANPNKLEHDISSFPGALQFPSAPLQPDAADALAPPQPLSVAPTDRCCCCETSASTRHADTPCTACCVTILLHCSCLCHVPSLESSSHPVFLFIVAEIPFCGRSTHTPSSAITRCHHQKPLTAQVRLLAENAHSLW